LKALGSTPETYSGLFLVLINGARITGGGGVATGAGWATEVGGGTICEGIGCFISSSTATLTFG
jgi:hypothetical protein